MEPTQPARRRRRAARRPAGPPAPTGPHTATGSNGLNGDESDPVGAERSTSAAGTAPSDEGVSVDTTPIADPDAEPAAPPTKPRTDDAEPAPWSGHGSPGAAPGHAPPSRERSVDRSTGPSAGEPRRTGRPTREESAERSLRSLVTTRSTQVSPIAAMRAREVALPSSADLEIAEQDLTIVRRHYVPPTALAAGRRTDNSNRRGGQSRTQSGATDQSK